MQIVPQQAYDFSLKDFPARQDNAGQQEDVVRRRSDADSQRNSSRPESGSVKTERVEDKVSLSEKEKVEVIRELAARDREVSAHEAAHAAVGGMYAGHPNFKYVQGPDGRRYKAGGEVSIDVSPVPNDPARTIDKAQIIRAAALAPADPSSADRAIAAKASRMANQARIELAKEKETDGQARRNGLESYEINSRQGDNDSTVRTNRIDLLG